jgi:hypothetical protein
MWGSVMGRLPVKTPCDSCPRVLVVGMGQSGVRQFVHGVDS